MINGDLFSHVFLRKEIDLDWRELLFWFGGIFLMDLITNGAELILMLLLWHSVDLFVLLIPAGCRPGLALPTRKQLSLFSVRKWREMMGNYLQCIHISCKSWVPFYKRMMMSQQGDVSDWFLATLTSLKMPKNERWSQERMCLSYLAWCGC